MQYGRGRHGKKQTKQNDKNAISIQSYSTFLLSVVSALVINLHSTVKNADAASGFPIPLVTSQVKEPESSATVGAMTRVPSRLMETRELSHEREDTSDPLWNHR